MVYLDYNATTPIDKEVLLSINEALLNAWGNPSSNSKSGILAKEIIKNSRNNLANMINANNLNEIIFTSGGTEANNMVINSVIVNFKENEFQLNGYPRIPHVITSNIEHDSIILPLKHYQELKKIELSIVPVSKLTGQVDAFDIINEIKTNTALITIMLANNETGIIQPVSQIGQALKSVNKKRYQNSLPKILFHTDAAQAIGKIMVDVKELAVDYLTIVGHKFYGPRNGALFVRNLDTDLKDIPLRPMFFGGGQERNYRPGTENTAMIAGLGTAAKLVIKNLERYEAKMADIRNYLEKCLKDEFGDNVVFNSEREGVARLPNTSNVGLRKCALSGKQILSSAKDIEASVGAACHGSNLKPSSILLASGVSEDIACHSLRLSVGRETTKKEIDLVIISLKEILKN